MHLQTSIVEGMDEREKRIRIRLRDDFEHYASKCLRIRTKSGEIHPLKLNRAQRYVHERLEQQLRETGKVRALLLKARQQGFSTYIGGRFYHKTSHKRGRQAFILTHEQDATNNLFGMTERYHEHCPALVRPHTGAANAKELLFDLLDSGYSVGTAGTKAVGRSKTIQFLHGSEVAFWPNAPTHFAGVVQAVPDLPGTEIILESTANGIGGEFHARWQQAENGIGDYIAVFVPWFWSDEYRRPVPAGFELEEAERELMALHDLVIEQIVWRRFKIAELKDPMLFMQEYPATAQEAFQMTGHDSYIKAEAVMKARKAELNGFGALVLGVDPARFGDDKFVIYSRQGRRARKVGSYAKIDVVGGANRVKEAIDQLKPKRVFIDAGGLGVGVIDILHSWGGIYKDIVVAVNFGGSPMQADEILTDGTKKPGPRNRRSEMWMHTKEWLDDDGGADIEDDDVLHGDLCGPGYRYDMNQRLILESKEDMRGRGVRSPDDGDALALTFAEPVFDAPDVKFFSNSRGVGGSGGFLRR